MPKIVDHDAYRQALVEQATALFAERGYHGVGMRDVARALGVSKSALYHYFPSKEALFAAVTEAVVQADVAAFLAQAPEAGTQRERMRALLQYCGEQESWFVQQLLVLVDYVRGKSAGTVREAGVLPEASEAYVDFIQGYLGLAERQTAVGVMVLINGLVLQRLLDGGRTDYEVMAEWVVEMVLG